MSIVCKDLSKYYGSKAALQNVSLQLKENCITGLVGPNGAGKSTLIKLITGLIHPSSGSVEIDNCNVHTQHRKALQHLGAIVEWPSFYADLSARRNLQIFSGGHGAAYEKKLAEVTSFLKIDHLLEKKVGVFSTGMKQRLGIALALLPNSKYIILDEPTNGLDPAGIVEIRQLISEYNRQYGITVLVSSHLLSEVEMICDDIVLIIDGQLRVSGALKDLLKRRRLRIEALDCPGTMAFLQQARNENQPWAASAPELLDGAIYIDLMDDTPPHMVSEILFKAGFSLNYFGCEQRKLEDFFLSHTGRQL